MAHRNSFFQIFIFISSALVCSFTALKTEAQEPLEAFPPDVMVHGQSQVFIMEGAELGEGKVTSGGFVSIGNNVEITGSVETLGSVTVGQRTEVEWTGNSGQRNGWFRQPPEVVDGSICLRSQRVFGILRRNAGVSDCIGFQCIERFLCGLVRTIQTFCA